MASNNNPVRTLDIIDNNKNVIPNVPIGSYSKYILHKSKTLEELLDSLNIGEDNELQLSVTVDQNKVALSLKQGEETISTVEFEPNDVETWKDIEGKPTLKAGINIAAINNDSNEIVIKTTDSLTTTNVTASGVIQGQTIKGITSIEAPSLKATTGLTIGATTLTEDRLKSLNYTLEEGTNITLVKDDTNKTITINGSNSIQEITEANIAALF